MHEVVVVGAGIAGLAAAWELRTRGLAPLVLEKSDRAGGVIGTDLVDGFVIDRGPDSLLGQKLAAIALVRELGLASRLIPTLPPRTSFVLKGRRLVRLPEASFLGLPTRIRPLLFAQLFSVPAKLRMATELLMVPRRVPDESIASFMRRHFGQEVVTYLAEPLLAGIHAGDAERLSVHALFPRLIEAEKNHGSVLRSLLSSSASRNPDGAFVSFPEGLAELVHALVGALGDGTIRYKSAVREIDRSLEAADAFRLTLLSGETIEARAVIVATPAGPAADLVHNVDRPLGALCAAIPYASSATVAFGLDRHQVRHPLKGTGFVVPRREKRALTAATWVTSKWPQRAPVDQVLLRAFLGGATDPAVLAKSDYELAQVAFDELAAILDIKRNARLTRVYRWPNATPQYLVGHLERVRQIDARLAEIPGLYLTGSGYRGTGIPDCISDARATAASAAAFLR